MDRRFGYFIFIGLLIGTVFGFGFGQANGNPLAGAGFGALAGVFLGWFIAAAVLQKR